MAADHTRGVEAVTVGLDIGTTSVKAVAADAEGRVLARARVPHRLVVPSADRMEHDANRAWRRGVRRALAEVSSPHPPVAACVAAMVPSLCAVDRRGVARTPGLLYGDARGRGETGIPGMPAEVGELVNFLRWCAEAAPGARGFWPAQAVANHALCGEGVLDSVTAMTAMPLFTGVAWDEAVAAELGITTSQLPRVVPGDQPAGRVGDAVLAGGTIDAFAEQLVAGADADGDVLVICGTTLITWVVTGEWVTRPGVMTIPHTTPGKVLLGGPSNAGGLFLDWASRLLGVARPGDGAPHPERVPVWTPYVRGERTPLHDPARRAGLHDLDLTHGVAAVRRAAFEAAGFVVRHHLDVVQLPATRIVATGGGTRVPEWVQALADCTGLPVDVVAVPEGAALGAAFLARVAAGLEASANEAARWARVARRVEPDPAWIEPCARRYGRFRELTAAG